MCDLYFLIFVMLIKAPFCRKRFKHLSVLGRWRLIYFRSVFESEPCIGQMQIEFCKLIVCLSCRYLEIQVFGQGGQKVG